MPLPSWTSNATGKQSGPNPHELLMQNTVSPFFSENVGRQPQGVSKGERVKECGESKCPLVTRGIGVATSPSAKAGRLPHGLS